MHYKETDYGFEYGALTISRVTSDEKKGWIVIYLTTRKANLQIYVTKTGKIRVFDIRKHDNKELTV